MPNPSPQVGVGFNTPFAEQLAFFQRKLNLPTERWDDILKSAHDRAFIVAGAANADLLQDIRTAVTNSIAHGSGLAAFRKEFDAIVLKHGWTGWTGEGSAAGQAWRTRVIYQTNMTSSYAAGRWQQLKSPAMLSVRPYWKYVHNDSVMHPRPLHVAWDGLVLPHDHPFWESHFPPNGWGCQCRIVAVDEAEYKLAKAEGRTEPPEGWDVISDKTGAQVGIDQGWNYAPGANATTPLKRLIDQKLINLDAPVGTAMYDAMLPVLRAEREAAFGAFVQAAFADPVTRGRLAVAGAIDRSTLDWLAARSIRPATAEIAVQDAVMIGKKAARHELAGDALSAEEWSRLPQLLETPERVLFDTRTQKLIYILASSDERQSKLAVEFDYLQKRQKGMTNLIVSGFKLLAEAIDADIKGGLFLIVK